ncbi:LOW QUALITY PROTEIN: putative FAD-dependent monooxygenase [Paramyrothecium foliicola]|nr:LOW QUALITY PROTEIN: putative FAD-dependent monooxygenase [Paramyrothecium foliicola]
MHMAHVNSNGHGEPHRPLPVLIIGAGISGLLLAQHLRNNGVPFRIFERDTDLETRGVGWGLTLHWSLPALRSLLDPELVRRLPEAYVDRLAVAAGESSRFPFYDLSTGQLTAETPRASEADRIRVTRQRLRYLLATGIDIEWGKAFRDFEANDETSVIATFDDGTSSTGCLLVACDGSNSRVRRVLFPEYQSHVIPVKVLGLKVSYTPEQVEPIRKMDPFFLQGTASQNDSFVYISMLDAPGNSEDGAGNYNCQMCISWPFRQGFFGSPEPIEFPGTNEGRHKLIQEFAATWAEPFRSLAHSIPEDTDIKSLEVQDFPPPKELRTTGRAVLMGDSLHAMAMYRGEGANHSIVDVLDFADRLTSLLQSQAQSSGTGFSGLRAALDNYEATVVKRARPGVLASRRACLDAHDWSRINKTSPLLTRRAMIIDFEEE